MAKTASSMIPLGSTAPDFTLIDTVSGQIKSLQEMRSDIATVIMFICNHCPFVKHIRAELAALADEYQAKGVAVIAINSNDAATYPDDSPENMKIEAESHGYSFPYLYDETQEVARAYRAECTPDFFIFDANLACVYRGQLDDSRPGNGIDVTGKDLRAALECVIAGKAVDHDQKPSIGCNIKWKNG